MRHLNKTTKVVIESCDETGSLRVENTDDDEVLDALEADVHRRGSDLDRSAFRRRCDDARGSAERCAREIERMLADGEVPF